MSNDELPLSVEVAELVAEHELIALWGDHTPPSFECSCGVALANSAAYGLHLVEMAR